MSQISYDELVMIADDLYWDIQETPWWNLRRKWRFEGAYETLGVLIRWVELNKTADECFLQGEDCAEYN